MIFIVVKWTIKPEYAGQWLDKVADFTAGTRAGPGNIFFEWNRSVDDPTVFTLVEAFQDGAAEAHVTSAHFKAAMDWMPDYVTTTPYPPITDHAVAGTVIGGLAGGALGLLVSRHRSEDWRRVSVARRGTGVSLIPSRGGVAIAYSARR